MHGLEGRHHGSQAGDFQLRRHGRGFGIGRGSADIDGIGAGGRQQLGMGDGRVGVEILPAIRKGVLGDVEDAEDFHGLSGAITQGKRKGRPKPP